MLACMQHVQSLELPVGLATCCHLLSSPSSLVGVQRPVAVLFLSSESWILKREQLFQRVVFYKLHVSIK